MRGDPHRRDQPPAPWRDYAVARHVLRLIEGTGTSQPEVTREFPIAVLWQLLKNADLSTAKKLCTRWCPNPLTVGAFCCARRPSTPADPASRTSGHRIAPGAMTPPVVNQLGAAALLDTTCAEQPLLGTNRQGADMKRHCLVAILAGMLFSPQLLCAQEIKPAWPMPPGLKWEAINGYPLSYRDEGTGPAIVLVHGSITDYRTWDAQFGVLTQKHRVVAPNLRHFYPERWQGEGSGFSIEQHASDVAALIKKLGLGRVHLVGWSRGGAIAIEIAKHNPDVIRTLVMADGSIVMPVPETPESKKAAEFSKNNIQTLQEESEGGRSEQGRRGLCRCVEWSQRVAKGARSDQGYGLGEHLHRHGR